MKDPETGKQKLLGTVSSHDAVKQLSVKELQLLAAELRERIVEVVSETGGHLASNLGTVELTIALHAVFDFRKDVLLFDVGHQCYAHKLLTGRNEEFATLRQRGGLSGYPSPEESDCDRFVVGHAGTAISSAVGLACGDKLAGRDRHIVALVGDGAMTSGLSLEGLNFVGSEKPNLLVVLNDNRMAIARTVGAMSRYLSRMRSDPLYNRVRGEFKRILSRIPLVGDRMDRLHERLLGAVEDVLMPGGMFREFGFRYVGPLDGHDVETLTKTLRNIRRMRGPVLLHVVTEKGRGHEAAAADPEAFHGAPPQSGERQARDEERETFSSVFGSAVIQAAEEDDRIVAITAAMPEGTGLSEFGRKFPERFFDVGIAEGHGVVFAEALAAAGMKPIASIYSTFLQRAYDNVFQDVCLQPGRTLVLALDRAGLVGADGPTHQGIYDVAYLRHLPGIVLMAPSDAAELRAMLRFALSLDRACVLRYPRSLVPEGEIWGGGDIELGRGRLLLAGERVAVLAYGVVLDHALAATRIVEEKTGLKLTVAGARFARPLDTALIEKLIAGHDHLVTVEDHVLNGGFGSAVLEGMEGREGRAKITRLGVPDRALQHASRSELLAECGIDGEGIARKVLELLKK